MKNEKCKKPRAMVRLSQVFLLLFLAFISSAQDTIALKKGVANLDDALIVKDTNTLIQLLDKHVTYGHSNGWVQTRSDVINDMTSGKLVYEKIESSDLKFYGNTDWASVRMNVAVKGKVNDKPFDLQLHVLEVWKKIRRQWKLIARQSAKIGT